MPARRKHSIRLDLLILGRGWGLIYTQIITAGTNVGEREAKSKTYPGVNSGQLLQLGWTLPGVEQALKAGRIDA
jgi:hypothetical protein